jgi:hypothetical protein
MAKKKAVITFELINESLANSNEAIAEDLLKWFRDEAVPTPWVKDVKAVVIQEF